MPAGTVARSALVLSCNKAAGVGLACIADVAHKAQVPQLGVDEVGQHESPALHRQPRVAVWLKSHARPGLDQRLGVRDALEGRSRLRLLHAFSPAQRPVSTELPEHAHIVAWLAGAHTHTHTHTHSEQAPGILICSLVQLLDVVSLSLLGPLHLDLSLHGQHLRQLEDLHSPCVRLLAGSACMLPAAACSTQPAAACSMQSAAASSQQPAARSQRPGWRTRTRPWHRPSCLLSFSGSSLQASCRSTSAPAPYCSAASRRSCQLRQTQRTAAKSRQTRLRPGSHRSLQPAQPCCRTLRRRRPSRLRPCQTQAIRAAAGRRCTGQQ